MRNFLLLPALLSLVVVLSPNGCAAFQSNSIVRRRLVHNNMRSLRRMTIVYSSSENKEKDSSSSAKIIDTSETTQEKEEPAGSAATNTINERLMAELKEARGQEKGSKSSVGKKLGLDTFRSDKTEEEREAAIQEARNLNGVNPAVALAGSAFALAAAAGLWALTNFLAEYFVLHPIESDTYAVERVTAVMRNVVMGIVALASGFFGVTGLGIFLLGVRVAYGVATGELDPTPIKKCKQDEVEMPNVWDLMMNKKPGRGR
jgi:hypothetical protein